MEHAAFFGEPLSRRFQVQFHAQQFKTTCCFIFENPVLDWSSSFLSFRQELYVRQIVPSQCLAHPEAMPLAVVRSWGEQAVSIMGQTSRCCMVCLKPQSHVSCSLGNPHFNMFTLDRPTCVRNRLSVFRVVQGFSAPAGRCSSALMLRYTLASRGSSRSLHISTVTLTCRSALRGSLLSFLINDQAFVLLCVISVFSIRVCHVFHCSTVSACASSSPAEIVAAANGSCSYNWVHSSYCSARYVMSPGTFCLHPRGMCFLAVASTTFTKRS